MFNGIFNWRTLLATIAILIVVFTVVFSGYLSKKIEKDERTKISLWIEAKNTEIKANAEDDLALTLAGYITTTNTTIPIIWTNEKDSIIEFLNGDTTKIKANKNYAYDQLNEFKKIHAPIIWIDPLDSTQKAKLYFGNSILLKQLKWFPIVQLLIVGLFILITFFAIQSRNKSTQNQVWVGMAKETAHQLGTPLNSLQGWAEVLKETNTKEEIVLEIQKDIDRLNLISDRFGKIGSTPKLEETNILENLHSMATYMKKRASEKINISVNVSPDVDPIASFSPQLMDWVLENLIKNALDSMDGKGSIDINLQQDKQNLVIDIKDTGKGIARNKWQQIFKPGFTTKKRGWGLGLSLTKRIVEQYHGGKIDVIASEIGVGTTFRIVLPKYAV